MTELHDTTVYDDTQAEHPYDSINPQLGCRLLKLKVWSKKAKRRAEQHVFASFSTGSMRCM